MSYKAIADRYSKALFELAVKDKLQDKVANDLASINSVINDSDQLVGVIASAAITRNEKISVFNEIADKIKVQKITKQFLSVVIGNGRASALKDIISSYNEQLRELKGEVIVSVATAKSLTKKSITEIEKSLTKILTKKVTIDVTTDENLLGGIVVTYGSEMFDGSLAGKLDKIQQLSKKEIANL